MEERKILRTILFRDNDLDGKGTEVVLRNARFINLVEVRETAVYKLEQDFKAMWFNGLLNPKQYDKVLITDLCINGNTAKLIREINEKHPNFVEVYDHHVTKLKEDWLHVDNTVSATKLVYNSFETMLIETERLDEFVELVNAWDTWEWAKTNNVKALELNDLCEYYATNTEEEDLGDFTFKMSVKVAHPKQTLVEGDDVYRAQAIKQARDMYIMDVEDYVQKMDHPFGIGRKCGVVYLAKPKYHSMVAHELLNRNKDLDYIVLVTDRSASFRTNREDFNLLDFVSRMLGGGGHPQACGTKVDKVIEWYNLDMDTLRNRKIVYTVEGRDSFTETRTHTFYFTRKSMAMRVLRDKQTAESECVYCNDWTINAHTTCDSEEDYHECFNEAERRALRGSYGEY